MVGLREGVGGSGYKSSVRVYIFSRLLRIGKEQNKLGTPV